MIAVKTANKIQFDSPRTPQEPVVVFDLSSIGINHNNFIDWIIPTYSNLQWDYYDVRREQIGILQKLYGLDTTKWDQCFLDYYRGDCKLEKVLSLLGPLPQNQPDSIMMVEPYRMRATADLMISRNGTGWDISKKKKKAVVQKVSNSDYRSIARVFEEIPDSTLMHPYFTTLVTGIANLVSEARANVERLDLTCWQTGIAATAQRAGSNSPEGIHQDGADYIVSALVLERNNINGGESRVWAEDKTSKYLSVTLEPGQGLFQADTGSTLWHDVTPISIVDSSKPGSRKILGFDICLG